MQLLMYPMKLTHSVSECQGFDCVSAFSLRRMSTATMQKTQEKTGSWSAIFPNETVTETQSALFVKKLLAVSVSNITYLRAIFPEHAFGDRCLEDLNLKILRDDSSCPGACQVIKWVKGCFDALDKKYLRMLIIGIYVDVNDPDTVIESYTFKFSYTQDGGIAIYRNEKKVSSAFNAEETKKATIRLLRTIVVLTQTLQSLPDDVMMTMKLLYYDDVTPPDYEPPGFKASEKENFQFEEEPMNIKVGDVSTPFHTVKIRIKTDSKQFDQKEDPEEEVLREKNKESGDQQSQMTEKMDFEKEESEQNDESKNEPSEISVSARVPNESPEKPDSALELASSQSQRSQVVEDMEYGVKCPCGCNEDDGLMVLCAVCKNWQHGVCFLIMEENEAPETHICDVCAKKEGRECTDPNLPSVSEDEVQALCLWRRALVACIDMNRILPPHLARRLGVEMTVAQGLIHRLEKEKFIKNPGKGKRLGKLVDKEKILQEGIPKYFKSSDVCESDKNDSAMKDASDQIEKLAAKTENMQLSRNKKKTMDDYIENKVRNELNSDSDGKNSCKEERNSKKRGKKRAISKIDETAEFDVCDSQEVSEDRPRKRKNKSSVVSKAILVVFYHLILKHLREQSSNKKSGTSITSTTNLVIPVVKYDADVFRSLIEFVHCGTAKIEMKTVAGLLCAADQFELDDLRRACWNFVEYCLESGKSGRLEKMARQYNYHEAGQRLISRIYRHYNMEDVRKLKYGQKKETTV
ncbi:hypothetical protein ScPMuIL_015623 [Solemya velum]